MCEPQNRATYLATGPYVDMSIQRVTGDLSSSPSLPATAKSIAGTGLQIVARIYAPAANSCSVSDCVSTHSE